MEIALKFLLLLLALSQSVTSLHLTTRWTPEEEAALDQTVNIVSETFNTTFTFVHTQWSSTGIPTRIKLAVKRKQLKVIKSIARELLPPIVMTALSQAYRNNTLPQLIQNNSKEVSQLCKYLDSTVRSVRLPLLVSSNAPQKAFRMLVVPPSALLQNVRGHMTVQEPLIFGSVGSYASVNSLIPLVVVLVMIL